MIQRIPSFLFLISMLGICKLAFAEITINEISCKRTERLLRWDENNQPYAGTGPAWQSGSFNDSHWKTGNTPIGYNLGTIRTNLRSTLYGVSPSFYLRKKFSISAENSSSKRPLILSINYNDGFIAWLNGVEIARANTGEKNAHIYWDQVAYRAGSSSTNQTNISLGQSQELLRTGTNTLAVQVANQNPLSGMRLEISLLIDETGTPDAILIPRGSAVKYFPGLMEPSADVYDPAILDNPEIENETSDWIELYNSENRSVDLSNWFLSDNSEDPGKWKFPNGSSVPAKGYLLILADALNNKVPQSKYLHTNFKLDGSGEFLGLFDEQGNLRSSFSPEYPEQYNFHSYGISSDGNDTVYFSRPTPGSENSVESLYGKVKAPEFSVKGGFFEKSVELTLSSETPKSTVIYTTNGTEPSQDNGSTYTVPLKLNKVSDKRGHIIRAKAFHQDLIPSKVKTNSYLIGQDSELLEAPSLIVTGDLRKSLHNPFGAFAINGGQYIDKQWQPTGPRDYNNIINRGRCYERPIHVEFYFADRSTGFRSDCGIRAAASSYSRPRMLLTEFSSSPWPAKGTQKPSFNLYFREEYGDSEVQLPLNGIDNPVNTYKRFRVRAGKNDIKNPFITDELVRRMSRDMGQPASTGVINTLYFNAELKGFYNMVERLRSPWFTTVHSSDPDSDWDTLALQGKASNVAEGNMDAWDEMISRLNARTSTTNWEKVLELADVTNMADYYLLNIYMATWDWPQNNWVAARERSDRGRYRLYVWDAEGAMYTRGNRPVSQEMILPFIATGSGELRDLWRALNRWEEFRILFADRINRHLFNGGVLDDRDFENSHLKKLANELYEEFKELLSFMNGEEISTINVNSWADPSTGRRTYLFGPRREEFRDNDLWPETNPPQFSKFGGTVPKRYPLAVTNESGQIYYTVDGTDPRLLGGNINPAAVSQPGSTIDEILIPEKSSWKYSDSDGDLGIEWTELEYNDSEWPTGAAPLGFGQISDTATLPRTNIPIVTQINPRPRQMTAYFRKTFQVTEAAAHFELRIGIISDGGGAVYINGKEVFRDSNLPVGAAFDTPTTNDASDLNEGDFDKYTVDASALTTGTNVIAIEMHNVSRGSSDMVMEMKLESTRTNPENNPLQITEPVTVMARSLDRGEWSALSSAYFTVNTVPAAAKNLAVMEMLYNPVGPTEVEIDAGHTDGDQFEFIRLKNISSQPIDLQGVIFADGIYFDFSQSNVRSLGAQADVIVVSDIAAFTTRNGKDYPIAGQYNGQLNNGGERVRIIASDGNPIQDYYYKKTSPWPDLQGSDGASIQIINPDANHDNGNNWKASTKIGGNPNGSLSFQNWRLTNFTKSEILNPEISGPLVDVDEDGLNNFTEFALGTPPRDHNNGLPMPAVSVIETNEEKYLVIEFIRAPGERRARFIAQTSEDLLNWDNNAIRHGENVLDPNGNIISKFRFPDPINRAEGRIGFLRLYITE